MGGPATGWKYMWNPSGTRGNAAAFAPLKWSNTAQVYNTTGGTTPTPGKSSHNDDYLMLTTSAGHPGRPNYSPIAGYTIQADDGAGHKGLSGTFTVVNLPPVAGADVIARFPTQGAKVLISQLLSNDSDPNGDVLTFTGVSANSAHGGTVTVQGDWVYYTPPPGFTNVDSFTYTIADGRGASVSGSVTINILVDNEPTDNLAIEDLGNGSFRVRFSGIPNRTYRIQFTLDMNSPGWQTLVTRTADALGQFEFVDTPPAGSPSRFYRSAYP
jgi:hypothetical protein